MISKRSSRATNTQIEQDWATFDQMRIVPHHIIDSDTLPYPSIPTTPIITSPSSPQLLPTSDSISTDSPTDGLINENGVGGVPLFMFVLTLQRSLSS